MGHKNPLQYPVNQNIPRAASKGHVTTQEFHDIILWCPRFPPLDYNTDRDLLWSSSTENVRFFIRPCHFRFALGCESCARSKADRLLPTSHYHVSSFHSCGADQGAGLWVSGPVPDLGMADWNSSARAPHFAHMIWLFPKITTFLISHF